MKSLSRLGPQLVLLVSVVEALSVFSPAQSTPQATGSRPSRSLVTIVRSVKVIPGKDGPVLEILSDRPISPIITKLDGPLRLIVDLPKARITPHGKPIDFRNQEISGVRLDQFQNDPPTARVVVDLVKPTRWTWEADGNRLMVTLHAIEDTSVRAPSTPAFTEGTQPIAVPVSPGATGTVVLAGSRVAGGSSITAGADTAILSLARGGVVHVCPGTTLSITPSQNGRDLMLGMSTGALETHYVLDASEDSILTPDFRILLTGPGVFHYAVSADSRGNTCVRALPGNTAPVVVTEVIGDGTYQVKPEEKIAFRSGRLNQIDSSAPDSCGCPPPPVPVLRTAAPPVTDDLPDTVRLALPTDEPKPMPRPQSNPTSQSSDTKPEELTLTIVGPETPVPASHPNQVHVQVEAPLVFRAGDSAQPAPTREAGRLPMTDSRAPETRAAVLPPKPNQPKPKNRGFFGKVKGFFAGLFH